MGTPEFAVPSLAALVDEHEVALVVTMPDRPSGRGGTLRPSPVKEFALTRDLELFQPATLRSPEAVDRIARAEADVACVAAFGMLLPPEILALPRLGCVNVHASLLPRHRGAAPIQRAILQGDAVTGVSIMMMEEGLDTGPYALQREVTVGGKTSAELEEELAHVGAAALLEVLTMMAAGSATWRPQDESSATYAAKVTKDDVALHPELTAAEALRRVQASSRRAPARACLGMREVTVVRATSAHVIAGPGAVCFDGGYPVLGFADGALRLESLRPSGGREMPGDEWARGARLDPGARWACTR